MALGRSPRQLAAIAVSKNLASELLDNPVLAETIERLRLERKKLAEICEAILCQDSRFGEKSLGVLTSAVSLAIHEIFGDELADQISRETHVTPKVPYERRTMSEADRKKVSIEGVKAQGKHVWSETDDANLLSCMESAGEKRPGGRENYWQRVSNFMRERHSISITPSACKNRHDKISKTDREEAA